MTVTQINLIAGEPGTGKTYTLTHLAKRLVQKGESIHIVSPTISARDNIKKSYDEFFKNGSIDRNEKITLNSSTQVLHGYPSSRSVNLIVEEAGLIEVTVMHGLLNVARSVPNVHIWIFADIKQLMPIQGVSIIENVMKSNNMNQDTPFWEWVTKCAYDDIKDRKLKAPYDWLVDVPIHFSVMRTNYRLQKSGFDSYNNDYYSHLIDNTIYLDDYSDKLKYAIENDYLIIAPTKNRGKEVNSTLSRVYQNSDKHAPFIIVNDDFYLNPNNVRYEILKEKFDFIKTIDMKSLVGEQIKTTAFITTHQAQGATVDNVCYYMGNKKIWKTHRSHYNNNQLYTAVTRSRFEVMLLGNPDSFKEMRTIMPDNAKGNLKDIRKKQVMQATVDYCNAKHTHPTADELYKLFNSYMNDDSILNDYELQLLNYYNTPQETYSQRYVVSQINRRVQAIEGFSTLGKWLSDNKKKSTKAPRKGKVKQWIDSLSDDELEQVKQDLSSRLVKQSEFTEKYGNTKKAIRQAL